MEAFELTLSQACGIADELRRNEVAYRTHSHIRVRGQEQEDDKPEHVGPEASVVADVWEDIPLFWVEPSGATYDRDGRTGV